MSDEKYPYVNHMNILCDALQLIDISTIVEKCTDQWYNQTLCKVNESVVRLGIIKGEYAPAPNLKPRNAFFKVETAPHV